MNARRINPSIREINDVLAVMERQWGEPYKRGNIFTAIIIAGVMPWALAIGALWVLVHG